MKAFENERIFSSLKFVDDSFERKFMNRKPRTGMLQKYIFGNYDLENSFVIAIEKRCRNWRKI